MARAGALTGVALVLAVLAVGYMVSRDKDVQRLFAAPTAAPTASPSPTPRPTPAAAVAPTSPAHYAAAFCSVDPVYLAANTTQTITPEAVAAYLAQYPACTSVRYLGAVNDEGVRRYVFVLAFGLQEDWFILTWDDTVDKMKSFARG